LLEQIEQLMIQIQKMDIAGAHDVDRHPAELLAGWEALRLRQPSGTARQRRLRWVSGC
jgi:hypothetical protein